MELRRRATNLRYRYVKRYELLAHSYANIESHVHLGE